MRGTIAILSLVACVVAEAPYNVPRPSTPFNYPPAPPPPQHHHHHHAPPPPPPVRYQQPQQIYQPQQQHAQNGGYQYQQPSIQPTFVQHAPQPQYQIPQVSLPIQIQPQPVYQQPAPIQYQPQPQPIYQPAPQPIYQPAPQPIPQPIYQPAPQLIPQPQPQYFQPPSTSYGTPQFRPQPQPQPLPIQIQPQPIPSYAAPQPRPQVQPQQVYQPVQQFSQQGYNYQQPQVQFSAQAQYSQLQSQPLTRNPVTTSLSSYQADSNQYSGAQAQGEALDSVVVNQVQNIIKESEHTSARDNGYVSLVSGVSLENAQPSIELSSFTHTSPLNIGSSQRQSSSVSAPSADYGQPSFTSVGSEQSSSGSASLSFLPQTKPATAYGPPNKK